MQSDEEVGVPVLSTNHNRSVPKSFKCHLIDHTRQIKILVFHFLIHISCVLEHLKLDYHVQSEQERYANFLDFGQTFHGAATILYCIMS